MSPHPNPFIRGYQNLRIVRTLCISYENGCSPVWRPLHASQLHLTDDQVAQFSCIFCGDFALIIEGQQISDELDDQCKTEGIVITVIYAILSDDMGQPVHVGDHYSEEDAHKVIRRLAFETGFYSRCWEISSSHITEAAMSYLGALADVATPSGLMMEAFRMPDSPVVGVKLFSTPWTDDNLRVVDGSDSEMLRRQHQVAGVPESLEHVLHLAAQADTRFLLFDPDAPLLDDLPQFEE